MKIPRKISITLVSVVALLSCKNANAQFYPAPYSLPVPVYTPDICGDFGDEWSANCTRDAKGNMIDGRNGDVYDENGNLLRRGRAKSQGRSRNNNRTYNPNSGLSNGSQASWTETVIKAALFHESGDLQSALKVYTKALSLSSNATQSAIVYSDRCMIYYGMGDLQSASRDCSQAIRLNHKLAEAYNNRAFVFYDQGDMPNAIGDWQRALIYSDSRLIEPRLALAIISYKQGDYNTARGMAAKALQMDSRYGNLQYLKREAHWSNIILRDASAFFQSLQVAQPEKITGVGLQIGQDKQTQKLMVISPIKGSPAASAGILPRDFITQIDAVSTQNMTVEQAVKLIKGTAGTDVTLIVLRKGQPLKFRLTRAQITVQMQRN
jgi:tetratricopeptide (TPR) repeat protein